MYHDEIVELSSTEKQYELDLGTVLSRAFEYTKTNLGTLWIMNLVYFFCSMALGITLIGVIALPALSFGYAMVAKKLVDGEQIEVGDIFKGFNHIGPTLKVGLVYFAFYMLIFIPVLLLFLPTVLSGDESALEAMMPLFMIVYMLMTLILSLGTYPLLALFGLAPHFKVFSKLRTLDAFKANFNFVKKRFWMWILIYLVGGIVGGLGTYILLLGLHFMPLVKAIAFFDIMKRQDQGEELLQQLESTL